MVPFDKSSHINFWAVIEIRPSWESIFHWVYWKFYSISVLTRWQKLEDVTLWQVVKAFDCRVKVPGSDPPVASQGMCFLYPPMHPFGRLAFGWKGQEVHVKIWHLFPFRMAVPMMAAHIFQIKHSSHPVLCKTVHTQGKGSTGNLLFHPENEMHFVHVRWISKQISLPSWDVVVYKAYQKSKI